MAANFGPAIIPVIDLTEALPANQGKKITIDIIKAYIEANFSAKVYHGRPSGNQAYSQTYASYTALNTNHLFILEFQTSNNADNPTLNISSLGALNIKIFDETLGTPDYRNLLTGEIEAGRHYLIGYEDTGGGFWKILNRKIENPKVLATEKGATNGVATLDANGKIPNSQIPSLATTEVIVAGESDLASFCQFSAGNHNIEKGDEIIINGATPKQFYMFLGGDPGDPNDYVATTPTQVEWNSVLNKQLADTATAGIVQLVNDLSTNDATKALTAAQGKQLKDDLNTVTFNILLDNSSQSALVYETPPQYFDYACSITQILSTAAISAVRYRKNGGSWSTALPLAIAQNDYVEYETTFAAAGTKGSILIKATKT